jgi:hypothetical protein
MRNDNATKVTKVLIHKLHGGRKQNSKFWQSEFSEENSNKTPSNKPDDHSSNIVSFFLYPIIFLAITITAYVGYYGYKEYFKKPSYTPKVISRREPVKPLVPTITPSKPKYYKPKPKQNRQKYSRTSENKFITKKELDRAIQNALNKQSSPIKTNNSKKFHGTPHYRVELTGGTVIRAKSAIKNGDHYTIKDIQGLEFSMLRSDIKSVKKIPSEY